MNELIPKNSRYLPITQQRWCCVPACISMIMYRHKIPLVPQEQMGHYLGLIVPKDQMFLFYKGETGPRPKGGYGTRIYMKQYYPDEAFKKLQIPLRMIFHPVDEFKDEKALEKLLKKIEKADDDAVLCFDYGTLHDHEYVGGHAVVFDRVIDGKARIVDPWFELPKWQVHPFTKILEAMKKHGKEQMGGVWEFVTS